MVESTTSVGGFLKPASDGIPSDEVRTKVAAFMHGSWSLSEASGMRFEIVDEEEWERQLNACARPVPKLGPFEIDHKSAA